jgi:large subunit ribosomal protein L1
MATRSRRYEDAAESIDNENEYDLGTAIELVREGATANFDETIESHVRLGIDPEDAGEQVRGSLVLPSGTGRDVTVVVFAQGEKVQEAEDAGADFVGNDDLIEKIQDGWLKFDQALATPDMMSEISALGPTLGPRGLMPNNKAGTVTFDLAEAIEKVKKGQIEVRNDSYGITHTVVGTDSMTADELEENLKALFSFLVEERPPAIQDSGQYFKSITLTSSMGPPVKVAPNEAWSVGLEG